MNTDLVERVQIIDYNGIKIKLKLIEFDEEIIDADKLTKIDMNNLIAEIVTTPVILNRMGNVLATVENEVKMLKLEFEVWEAKEKEVCKVKLADEFYETNKGKKNPTIADIESAVKINKYYMIKKKQIYQAEQVRDTINSLFWTLKSKCELLTKMSQSINRDDITSFESVTINQIKIVINKKPLIN
jgi:hypothetical protein